MDDIPGLPENATLVRTTAVFDRTTVPKGLLSSHRIADGVHGRLVVSSGSIRFVFEDTMEATTVTAGESLVIPPARPHRLEVVGAVTMMVEFYR